MLFYFVYIWRTLPLKPFQLQLVFWITYFPLRRACLFSYGKNKTFSLLSVLKFCVWISPPKLHSGPLKKKKKIIIVRSKQSNVIIKVNSSTCLISPSGWVHFLLHLHHTGPSSPVSRSLICVSCGTSTIESRQVGGFHQSPWPCR